MSKIINQEYANFLTELKQQVLTTRYNAVKVVNRQLVVLYHYIGSQILLRQQQFGWGNKVLEQLSRDLKSAFPNMTGFSLQNLKYMRKLAEVYTLDQIGQQLVDQLPWGHVVMLIYQVPDGEARQFYIKQTIEHGWSRNTLSMQIETNLYQRQGKAITNFNQQLLKPQSDLANQALKDPYFFDFLSIGADAHEREVEKALIQHMEKFLLELGTGFAFVGRQFHLEVAGDDFYLDLLFYHLKLRCYVVCELKADKFKPEYVGKMNFYLSAVDEVLKHPQDNPSIGLILCRDKNNVMAEYALRDINKPIGLAEYRLTEAIPQELKTQLPTIEELEQELKFELEQ